MRRMIFSFILALSLAMCPSWTWATDQKPHTLEDLIEKEIWIIFAHDPAGYLLDAWENFLNGDLREAAYNMRKTKALLKLEAHRAESEARGDLEASIRGLEKLIKVLEDGSPPTSNAVKKAFAGAEYALAYHHHQKALSYGAKGDHENMTYALDAAATHLLYGSTWAERELDPTDAVITNEARSIAREAIRDSKWVAGKLREAIKGIGRGIKKLGNRLKQAKEGS